MDFLSSLKFDSVLDVGCGFGRVTKLIDQRFDCSRIVGIDLSEYQIANARKYAGDRNIEFNTGNVLNMRFSDESFDLVFSCTLLMHISPRKVRRAISETVRLSRRYVINVDWYEADYDGPRAQHNWCHDYFDLYGKTDFRVTGSRTIEDSNQYLFCLDKNKEG
jgi:ubiquinone/menaquinone biosynthesis C-methylase UbiE